MLDGEGEVSARIDLGSAAEGDPTDQLVEEMVTCWTYGSAVEPAQVESTVEQLRDRSRSRVSRVEQLGGDIEDSSQRNTRLNRPDRNANGSNDGWTN